MIVALNNKSNLTKDEYVTYVKELQEIEHKSQMILCPTQLNLGSKSIDTIDMGAQNVSITGSGAYTGEVSADQLKSYNVKYCIVGHSERRQYQKESNSDINKKIKNLLKENIIPILCIGETKEERENNKVEKVLKDELLTALEDINNEEKDKIIIAYEPIWSIGTGLIPRNQEIEEVFKYIKNYLPNSKILYGGSANEKNIETLKQVKIIDGYLLGGLSLKLKDLEIFIKKIEN